MSSQKQTPQAVADFIEALRGAARPIAEARLLNTADRDLAAVLSPASPAERTEVLAFLGAAKRRRIEEELERMAHVRLAPETVERLARHLTAHVSGDKPLGPGSRYFRPVTPD